MQIDPHRLLVLRAVRRTGSIQAAATALRLTPSGLSQHLTRLESETGLALLDRSRRGGGRAVRLTDAGLALAGRADTVAGALAEAGREVDRLRDGSQGAVRVGGFATALTRLAVPVVVELSISDPAIRAEIVEIDEPDGLDRLRLGELDLLLSTRDPDGPGLPSGVDESDLCRDHYRVVVPALWERTGDIGDLLAGPWVTSPPDHPTSRILHRLRHEHRIAPGVHHVCTESRTRLALVAAGLGAAIVPELTLAALPVGGVAVHPGPAELGSRVLTALTPSEGPSSAAVERFTRHLTYVAGDATRS
ncbi:LysR family transcriptional regulator [Pseudonocardia endophytica]|uniref:DNA-binding transcriptional LysR family regulator n=1 Tax=Pseudonocardia endophytica TaxID=401976 RepID=A0A4V2PJ19_PSEEN|nr:LysR family transcriptional regulator [Pseudonocardia endophytica]TCK26796.1 DNA-binding transcriptional LysR family regulator [Pseudonocardia endophytica]